MTDPKLAKEQVEALYRRHAAGVRRFLLGVLRDQDLVGEALQGTFLQVVEKGHTADDETMKGWIYKVAFHQAMRLRRRRKGRMTEQLTLDPVLLAGTPVGDAGRDEQTIVEHAIAEEEIDLAQAAVRDLPSEQQEVLRMRFQESKTFAQIAEQLGVPLGTALTRMRLALTKLRRRLT